MTIKFKYDENMGMFLTKFKDTGEEISRNLKTTWDFLEKDKEILKKLEEFISGFEELQYVIPTELDKHNITSPWLFLFHEADQELDSIIITLLAGMYKDSIRALRSFLELNITGFYFFTKDDLESFMKWLYGLIKTPRRKVLIDYLKNNNDNFKKLETHAYWSLRVFELYDNLDQYTHTRGKDGSFSRLRNSNKISFEGGTFKRIVFLFSDVVRLVSMGWVATFPLALQPLPLFEKFGFSGPATGFLDISQVGLIKKIFTSQDLKVLTKISDEDKKTIAIVESILSMKNLNAGELNKTLTGYLNCLNKKERAEILSSIKTAKNNAEIVAMITARQKALIRCLIPLVNEILIGVRKS